MTGKPGRRTLLTLGSIGLLAGCGFQPIYMRTASGQAGPAQREMAAININPINDRPGQLLRQNLQERLENDAGITPYRYDLVVTYTISGEGIGIEADNVATRIRLVGTANWTLIARDAAQTRITSGTARTVDGFDVLDEQLFAADLDTEIVQRRMSSALADQVAIQLAVFFRRRAAVASS